MNKQTLCPESDEDQCCDLETEANQHAKFYDYMSADEDILVDAMDFNIKTMMAEVFLKRMRAKPGDVDKVPTTFNPAKVAMFMNQSKIYLDKS